MACLRLFDDVIEFLMGEEMNTHFFLVLPGTKTHMCRNCCHCAASLTWEEILTDHSCKQGAFANACMPNQFHRVLTGVVEDPGCFCKALEYFALLLVIQLFEMWVLKKFCAHVSTLDLRFPLLYLFGLIW